MPGTAIATAGRLLWRMLERQGINPALVYNKAGLDPESLDNPLVLTLKNSRTLPGRWHQNRWVPPLLGRVLRRCGSPAIFMRWVAPLWLAPRCAKR